MAKYDLIDGLAERCASWTTEELVRATIHNRRDYVPEALAVLDGELRRRDVGDAGIGEMQTAIQKEEDTERAKLNGIRGWLLMFVVIFCFNILILAAWAFLEAMIVLSSDAPSPLGVIYLLGLIGLIPYSVAALVALITKKRYAPRRVVISLVWGFVLGVLAAVFVGNPGPRLFSGIATGLWWAYFAHSRRVAATYGKPEL